MLKRTIKNPDLLRLLSGNSTTITAPKLQMLRERAGSKFELPEVTGIKPSALVGDFVARRLKKLSHIKPSKGCKCTDLQAEMNENGPDWVLEKIDTYIIPKMLENMEVIRSDLEGQSLWAKTVATASGLTSRKLRTSVLRKIITSSVAKATEAVEVHKSLNLRSPITSAGKKTGKSFVSAFRAIGKPRFVSSQQFQEDIKRLVSKLPSDITAIAGVARSGLSAATMISMYLHLPMFTVRQTMNDIIHTGNGWRLGKNDHIKPNAGKVAVIDDTCMTGNSLRAIDPLLKSKFGDYVTATVYCNPLATDKPDIHAVSLPWPHLLEWNLFNSVLSPNMAVDFDGILCRDCPAGSDDDGEKYLDFISNAQPLFVPRRAAIPLIVTARIEKYRKPTMDWLARHGITVNRLVMHPAATLAERQKDDIAAYKARHFASWAKSHKMIGPPPLAFIESEDWQARRIAQITGKMTICPATAKVY